MKRNIAFLWILISFSVAVKANHIYGGSIGYKNLGNLKYEITVTMYRDCGGSSLTNTPATVYCGTTNLSVSLSLQSVRDVTGLGQQCTTKSSCSGFFAYGIEEHTYKGVADVSGFTCCRIYVSYTSGGAGRITATTISAGTNTFYMDAWFDRCEGTSLEWGRDTKTLLELGQDQILNFSAYDTIDKDSISYSLANPLYAASGVVTYSGSYSYLQPVSFLGFPNASLNYPAGFRFDPARGNLIFRPTSQGQVTIMAVEVSEWRDYGGTKIEVGHSRKDMAVTVVSGQNNSSPYQNAPDYFYACPGDTSVAIIDIKDNNTSDILSINFTHNLKWATAELIGGPAARKVKIRYLPAVVPTTGISSAFTLTVTDNACPLQGRCTKTYGVRPGGSQFTDSTTFTKSTACGKVTFQLVKKMTGNNFLYSWILNGQDVNTVSNGNLIEATVPKGGWVKAELLVFSTLNCNYYRYIDSIFVDSAQFLGAFAGQDDTICQATSINLSAQVKGGFTPYTFTWPGTGNGQALTVSANEGINTFYLQIKDSNNCIAYDTLTLFNSIPVVATPDKGVVGCATRPAVFTTDSTLGLINWQHINIVDSNYISGTDKFIAYKEKLYLEDSAGCNAADSSLILVSYISTDLPVRTNYCKDSILTVAPVIHSGNQPLSYLWYTGSTAAVFIEKIMGIPANTVFLVKVTITDKYGCVDSAVGQAKVLPLPAVTITKPKDACTAGQVVNLTANGQPAGGLWAGTAITGSAFSPGTAGKGNFPLSYRFTDTTTGCVNGGTTDITVINPPVIDFTADTTKILPGRLVTFTNHTTADKAFNSSWRAGQMTGQNKDAVFLFSTEGEYDITLRITDGVCPPDSVVKTGMIKVGSNYLSVNKPGKILNAYPNPATDKLYFDFENMGDISGITITDITGREITPAFAIAGNEIVNTGNYKGICLVTITTVNNQYYYSKIDWR